MEMTVVRPGPFAAVQDLGRPGARSCGVPAGGAMDAFALRVGNILVGNPEDAAGVEVTLGGAEFAVAERCVVAVTGAEYEGVPAWRPFVVPAGGTVKLGTCKRGYRGYLTIRGGIDVPDVMGSRSTYTRAAMGGLEGRALKEGDRLGIGGEETEALGVDAAAIVTPPPIAAAWDVVPPYSSEPTVRVVAGAQAEWFGVAWMNEVYRVLPQSDRMGLRLQGPKIGTADRRELVSSGVVPGTVQVPPDGQPIVLGADAQTLGGYPQVAHVALVDMPLIAQVRPGDRMQFRSVTLAEAQWLALKREQEIALLRTGAGARWTEAVAAAAGGRSAARA